MLDAALFGAGLSRLFPELGEAWRPKEYYFFSFATTATHYVDITKLLPLKAIAYEAHKSQYPNVSYVAPGLEQVARMIGRQNGLDFPAETFQAYF